MPLNMLKVILKNYISNYILKKYLRDIDKSIKEYVLEKNNNYKWVIKSAKR